MKVKAMKYTVKCSCGHETVIDIFGESKLEAKKEWYAKHYVCRECFIAQKNAEKAQRAVEIAEENKHSAEMTAERGLPELEGTEKQVAWANSIRENVLKNFLSFCKTEEEQEQVMRQVCKRTAAKHWITRRDAYARAIEYKYIEFWGI